MTQNEQQDAFVNELYAVINRFIDEYDLTLASAVGCLEVVKTEMLMNEISEHNNDEDK